MNNLINDNAARSRGPEPDAHGQAALLLVESLLHGLIARKVISLPDASEIVTVAAEVKQEIADDLGDSREALTRSLGLLGAIGASLAGDLPVQPLVPIT